MSPVRTWIWNSNLMTGGFIMLLIQTHDDDVYGVTYDGACVVDDFNTLRGCVYDAVHGSKVWKELT